MISTYCPDDDEGKPKLDIENGHSTWSHFSSFFFVMPMKKIADSSVDQVVCVVVAMSLFARLILYHAAVGVKFEIMFRVLMNAVIHMYESCCKRKQEEDHNESSSQP